VMKFAFRKIPENFLTTWETVSSWRKTLIRGVSLLISSTMKKEANFSYRPQGCTIHSSEDHNLKTHRREAENRIVSIYFGKELECELWKTCSGIKFLKQMNQTSAQQF
jgi:hypothetical protein